MPFEILDEQPAQPPSAKPAGGFEVLDEQPVDASFVMGRVAQGQPVSLAEAKIVRDSDQKGEGWGKFLGDVGHGLWETGKGAVSNAGKAWMDPNLQAYPLKKFTTLAEGALRGTYDLANMARQAARKGYDKVRDSGAPEDEKVQHLQSRLNQSAEWAKGRAQGWDGQGTLTPFVGNLPDALKPMLAPSAPGAEAASLVLDPTLLIGGEGAVGKGLMKAAAAGALKKIPGAAKVAQLASKAAELAPKVVPKTLEGVEKAANAVKEAAAKPGAFVRRVPEEFRAPVSTAALPVTAPALATRKVAGAVSKVAEFTRRLSELPGATQAGSRLQQLAKDASAPAWARNTARVLDARGVGSAAFDAASELGKGAAHGGAYGAALGAGTAETSEERAHAIGGGMALGAAGRVGMRYLPAGRAHKIAQMQANDLASLFERLEGQGTRPELLDKLPSHAADTLAAYTAAVDPSLKVTLHDDAGFAAAAPEQPNAAAFYNPKTHEVVLNLDRLGSATGHELGHALMSARKVDGEARLAIDSALGTDGVLAAAREYAGQLVDNDLKRQPPPLPGQPPPLPQAREQLIANKIAQLTQAHGGDGWVYSEIVADAAKNQITPDLYKNTLRPSMAKTVLEALGAKARGDLAGMLPPGALFSDARIYGGDIAKMLQTHLRESHREGIKPTTAKEEGVNVPSDLLGKHASVPVGSDAVKVEGSAIVPRTPAEVRQIEKARQQAVKPIVDQQPKPQGDVSPEVAPRVGSDGTVEVRGTKISDQIAGLPQFSDEAKRIAKQVEDVIAGGQGGIIRTWYQALGSSKVGTWAKSVRKKLGNWSVSQVDIAPYEFHISDANNVLVRGVSRTAAEQKLARWQQEGKLDKLWGGDADAFRKDLHTYLQNHAQGLRGAVNLGDEVRDALNLFVTGQASKFKDANPLRADVSGKDKNGIIRSIRLDRMANPEHVEGSLPLDWTKQQRNFSPAGDDPVVAAALRTPGGQIFSDRWHGGAMMQIMDAAGRGELKEPAFDFENVADGFVTKSGKFLSREEALQHAQAQGQLPDSARFENGQLESDAFAAQRSFSPSSDSYIDDARDVFARAPSLQTLRFDRGTGELIDHKGDVVSENDLKTLAPGVDMDRVRGAVVTLTALQEWEARQGNLFSQVSQAPKAPGEPVENRKVLYAPSKDKLGFYSQLEETLKAIPPKSSPAQIRAMLRQGVKEKGKLLAKPVKAEEMRDTKAPDGTTFEEWLNENPKATLDEIKSWAQVNKTKVYANEGANKIEGEEYTSEPEPVRFREAHYVEIAPDHVSDHFRQKVEDEFHDQWADEVPEEMTRPEFKEEVVRRIDAYLNEHPVREWTDNEHGYTIQGSKEQGYAVFTPDGDEVDSEITRFSRAVDAANEHAFDAMSTTERHDDEISTEPQYSSYVLGKAGENYQEVVFEVPGNRPGSGFESSHFSGNPDYIFHARTSEYKTPKGEKVFLIEETQSDLHRGGREEGYKDSSIERKRKQLSNAFDARRDAISQANQITPTADLQKLFADDPELTRIKAEREKLHESQGKLPDAPLKKSWSEFLLKWGLREAAARGAQYLGWVTGGQTQEHYNLRKEVKELSWDGKTLKADLVRGGQRSFPAANEEEVAKYVGKGVASRLVTADLKPEPAVMTEAQWAQKFPEQWAEYAKSHSIGRDPSSAHWKAVEPDGASSGVFTSQEAADLWSKRVSSTRSVSGGGLEMGGEWAVNMYDKAHVNFLEDYAKSQGWLKALGAEQSKPDPNQLELAGMPEHKAKRAVRDVEIITKHAGSGPSGARGEGETAKVHAIAIPPEVKDHILHEGQPMYSPSSEPAAPDTLTALHNTSGAGILAAARMGGIPAPSVAVMKREHPFSSFGDITLIAPRDVVDPEHGTKVFDADAYTPRQPKPEYGRIRSAAKSQLRKQFEAEVKRLDDYSNFHEVLEALGGQYRTPSKEKAIEAMGNSPAVVSKFLADTGGNPADVYRRQSKPGASSNEYSTELLKERETLRKILSGRQDEFNSWAENILDPVFGQPFVKVGGQRLPYTAENVARAMTGKTRAQEGGMTYGPGHARASASRQFGSVPEMHKAEGNLVSDDDFQKHRDAQEPIMDAYRRAAVGANNIEHRSTWDNLDDAMRVLGMYLRGGKSDSPARMAAALRRHGFGDDPEVVQAAIKAAGSLRDAPTEYFEAKPQREVKLPEFVGAVVPEKTSPRVLAVLEKYGIQVETYKNSEDRQAATVRLREKLAGEGQAVHFAPSEDEGFFYKADPDLPGHDPKYRTPEPERDLPDASTARNAGLIHYWQAPSGNLYDADRYHWKWAREHVTGDAADAVERMIRNGWTRINVSAGDRMVLVQGRPSRAQRARLEDLGFSVELPVMDDSGMLLIESTGEFGQPPEFSPSGTAPQKGGKRPALREPREHLAPGPEQPDDEENETHIQ